MNDDNNKILLEQENILRSFFRGLDSIPNTAYEIERMSPEKITVINALAQSLGFAIRASLIATSPVFAWSQLYKLTFETQPPNSFLDLISQISNIWANEAKFIIEDIKTRLKNAGNYAFDKIVVPSSALLGIFFGFGGFNYISPTPVNTKPTTLKSNPQAFITALPIKNANISSIYNDMNSAYNKGNYSAAQKYAANFINIIAKFNNLVSKGIAMNSEIHEYNGEKEFYKKFKNKFDEYGYEADDYEELLLILNSELLYKEQDKELVSTMVDFCKNDIEIDVSGHSTYVAGMAGINSQPLPVIPNEYPIIFDGSNIKEVKPNNFFDGTAWKKFIWIQMGSSIEKLILNGLDKMSNDPSTRSSLFSKNFAFFILRTGKKSLFYTSDKIKGKFLEEAKKYSLDILKTDDSSANEFVDIWNNIISNEEHPDLLDDFYNKINVSDNKDDVGLNEQQTPDLGNNNPEKSKNNNLQKPKGLLKIFDKASSDIRLTKKMYDIIDEFCEKVNTKDSGVDSFIKDIFSKKYSQEEFNNKIKNISEFLIKGIAEKISAEWALIYQSEINSKDPQDDIDENTSLNAKNKANLLIFGSEDIEDKMFDEVLLSYVKIYSVFRVLSNSANK